MPDGSREGRLGDDPLAGGRGIRPQLRVLWTGVATKPLGWCFLSTRVLLVGRAGAAVNVTSR